MSSAAYKELSKLKIDDLFLAPEQKTDLSILDFKLSAEIEGAINELQGEAMPDIDVLILAKAFKKYLLKDGTARENLTASKLVEILSGLTKVRGVVDSSTGRGDKRRSGKNAIMCLVVIRDKVDVKALATAAEALQKQALDKNGGDRKKPIVYEFDANTKKTLGLSKVSDAAFKNIIGLFSSPERSLKTFVFVKRLLLLHGLARAS